MYNLKTMEVTYNYNGQIKKYTTRTAVINGVKFQKKALNGMTQNDLNRFSELALHMKATKLKNEFDIAYSTALKLYKLWNVDHILIGENL